MDLYTWIAFAAVSAALVVIPGPTVLFAIGAGLRHGAKGALAAAPDLLLLDEPTAGMARADTNNTIDLLKEINEKRAITMAIIEHDMHVVFSLAERITVLAQGTPLVEDTPENIKGHPKVREAYLGESA